MNVKRKDIHNKFITQSHPSKSGRVIKICKHCKTATCRNVCTMRQHINVDCKHSHNPYNMDGLLEAVANIPNSTNSISFTRLQLNDDDDDEDDD